MQTVHLNIKGADQRQKESKRRNKKNCENFSNLNGKPVISCSKPRSTRDSHAMHSAYQGTDANDQITRRAIISVCCLAVPGHDSFPNTMLNHVTVGKSILGAWIFHQTSYMLLQHDCAPFHTDSHHVSLVFRIMQFGYIETQ